MYVHGFVGLGLFMTWLLVEVIRSGRVRRSSTWWTHLSLLMALVEVPFYGLLPQVVIFGVAVEGPAHHVVQQRQVLGDQPLPGLGVAVLRRPDQQVHVLAHARHEAQLLHLGRAVVQGQGADLPRRPLAQPLHEQGQQHAGDEPDAHF